jgi:hypothetical protein
MILQFPHLICATFDLSAAVLNALPHSAYEPLGQSGIPNTNPDALRGGTRPAATNSVAGTKPRLI